MIVLSNIAAQVIPAGGSLVFDRVVLHKGCDECHRPNTGAVKLKRSGLYEIHFNANIGGTAIGPAQLSIALGGEVLPETTAISQTAAVGDLNNISVSTIVKNCCGDYDRVTVVNNGTAGVTVGTNASLVIHAL